MDDHERMALRRRKPVFAESVDVNSELLTDLQARGLLGDDALEQLKVYPMYFFCIDYNIIVVFCPSFNVLMH